MYAGGVRVNNAPKIHCEAPEIQDHSILFEGSELWIPLQLDRIFLYFHTRIPIMKELHKCEKLFLSLDSSD